MSFSRNNLGNRPTHVSRQQSRPYSNHSNPSIVTTNNDVISFTSSELIKINRRLLPHEIPTQMHVHDVEYIENGHERLVGTLFMTTFRLIFAPDKEAENQNLITTGNKYIGEFDIPLASIYKVNVAPVDSRSGFKSFLNDHQIQSETRTFTIITRDFRSVTFTKFLVTNSNTNKSKNFDVFGTKMETYIDTLRVHSRFHNHEQLYLHLAVRPNPINNFSPRASRSHTFSSMTNSRSIDDDYADFCLSNDERIKSYMIVDDWKEELYEANEQDWSIDRKKFTSDHIAREDGPYVCFMNSNDSDGSAHSIWHWSHVSQINTERQNRRQIQPAKYMLITVPNVADVNNTVEPLRRVTTDTSLMSSSHYICEKPFQRYNLAKFPCQLKRLQTSYEKLIEICVISLDEDDEKWLSKLNTCKWLKYVSKTLHGAASLAKLLNFRNIELAGSDTDYNCLMSSLIQIFVRPKCRTIKGFCELIVREWIVRGHKFRERFGQVQFDANEHAVQEAPVFLLFLDCVHQLIVQNPFSFEFTDYLLLELYRNLCYCYQHTFAFNSISERLDAIKICPNNILVLSAFDFSLYLNPDSYRLLRNEASIFNTQKHSTSRQPIRPRIETTVIYPPSSQQPNRTVYLLETPKSPNFRLDIPLTNGISLVTSEQYEYDMIESPQTFQTDFHVDWRTFNLVLWSKCYCRYDQINSPSVKEQDLSNEINSLKEDLEKIRNRSKRSIRLDTYHGIGYANSWHPQALDTRV